MNSTLRRLVLSRCNIGDALSKLIGRGLGLNKVLQKMDLSSNCLSDECMSQFVKGLARSQLKELDLSSNQLKDHSAVELAKALSRGGDL